MTQETIDAETGEISVAQPAEPANVNLTEVALSRFGEWRIGAFALVQKYKDVVFDVATTKGMQAAVAARMEVRAPRYAAQNVAKASKSELAAVSKAVGAEEAAIIKFLADTEEHIDRQIRAEEERKALAKAEAERLAAEAVAAEERRVAALREGLAVIDQYPVHAAGKPAARIELGVKALQEMTFGEAQGEFLDEYQAARDSALATLLQMLEQAWADERAREKIAAQLAEIEAKERAMAERERRITAMEAEAKARMERHEAAIIEAKRAETERLDAAFAAAAAEASRIDGLAKQIGEELTTPQPAAAAPGEPTAADQAPGNTQAPAEPAIALAAFQPDIPGIPAPPTDEEAAEKEPHLIPLGEVSKRMGMKVTEADLARIGFQPDAKRGVGVYFKERSLVMMCHGFAVFFTKAANRLEEELAQ